MYAKRDPSPVGDHHLNHYIGRNDKYYTLSGALEPQSTDGAGSLPVSREEHDYISDTGPYLPRTCSTSTVVQSPEMMATDLNLVTDASWFVGDQQYPEPQDIGDVRLSQDTSAIPAGIDPQLTLLHHQAPSHGTGCPVSRSSTTDVQRTMRRTRADSSPYVSSTSRNCKWVDDNGSKCERLISPAECPEHLAIHNIKNLPSTKKILCKWEGCFKTVKRESIVRHVREKHLGVRRGTLQN